MAEQSKTRVKYVGPARRQVVTMPDGTRAYCDRNKSIEVDAATAKGLLQQDIWEKGQGVKAEPKPDEPKEPK